MATYTWIGGPLDNPNSWSPTGDANHPSATDTVVFPSGGTLTGGGTITGALEIGEADFSGSTALYGNIHTHTGGVWVKAGASLTIQAGATLTAGQELLLGLASTLNGGTNTVNVELDVLAGSYFLDAGALSVGDQEFIANSAKDGKVVIFNQFAGTNIVSGTSTVTGQLNVGYFAGSVSNYDGNGNPLSGDAKYTLSGGTLIAGTAGAAADPLKPTASPAAIAGAENIGNSSIGVFVQSGGSNTIFGNLSIGLNENQNLAGPGGTNFGIGDYKLSGTGNLSVQGIILGVDPNCQGTLQQSGGTLNDYGVLTIGGPADVAGYGLFEMAGTTAQATISGLTTIGSNGGVAVDGGASLSLTHGLLITDNGEFSITNGGTVAVNGECDISQTAGSSTISVDGIGSSLNISFNLFLNGIVSISNGAHASVPGNNVYISSIDNSSPVAGLLVGDNGTPGSSQSQFDAKYMTLGSATSTGTTGGFGTLRVGENGCAGLVTVAHTLTLHDSVLTNAQGNEAPLGGIFVGVDGSLEIGGQGTAGPNMIKIDLGGSLIGHGLVSSTTIENDGLITATEGLLILKSNITGNGFAVIGNNSTLEINGSFSSTDTVVFAADSSTPGTLILDQPTDASGQQTFNGIITALAPGDTIELNGITVIGQQILYTSDGKQVLDIGGIDASGKSVHLDYQISSPGNLAIEHFAVTQDGANASLTLTPFGPTTTNYLDSNGYAFVTYLWGNTLGGNTTVSVNPDGSYSSQLNPTPASVHEILDLTNYQLNGLEYDLTGNGGNHAYIQAVWDDSQLTALDQQQLQSIIDPANPNPTVAYPNDLWTAYQHGPLEWLVADDGLGDYVALHFNGSKIVGQYEVNPGKQTLVDVESGIISQLEPAVAGTASLAVGVATAVAATASASLTAPPRALFDANSNVTFFSTNLNILDPNDPLGSAAIPISASATVNLSQPWGTYSENPDGTWTGTIHYNNATYTTGEIPASYVVGVVYPAVQAESQPGPTIAMSPTTLKLTDNVDSIIGLDSGGSNLVASGGGNLVASGGGNLVASGGGNLVASGGGNLVASGGGNLVASGGGNLVASGGGNLVASGGGNLVSAGGGNVYGLSGIGSHSYLANSLVFADANGDGVLDDGEVSAVTDATGHFQLVGGSGQLILQGGTDTSTGLPFAGTLIAPLGSSDISSLTTLVAGLAQKTGTIDGAITQVQAALGINPNTNITIIDPVAGTLAGDSTSAVVNIEMAKVMDSVDMIRAALSGLGASGPIAGQDAFASMVNVIAQSGSLNLSDKATVAGLIASVAGTLMIDVSGILGNLSNAIATSNQKLDQFLATDGAGPKLVSDIVSVESSAQAGNGPSVLSVAGVTDNHLTDVQGGHLVTVAVNLDAAVTVTGTPTLQLNDNEVAFYTGGSGTNTLSFVYVVNPLDNVPDLQVTGLNLPNGASILDGNDNSLSGPVTGDLGLTIAGKLTPATVAQEIHGLYLTLYGIAATQPGIIYWENYLHDKFDPSITVDNAATTAVSLNDQTYLGEQMTAGSPIVNGTTYFATLYPTSMSDMDYVKALYQNMSNFIGTVAGDNYWFNVLQQAETTNGNDIIGARESIAGQFVHDFLSNDLTIGAAALNVSPSDYTLLVNGQQALLNRALISQDYADETVAPGGSIINFTTVTSPAFAAAHNVVAAVTSDPASVAVAITGINNAIAQQDLSLI